MWKWYTSTQDIYEKWKLIGKCPIKLDNSKKSEQSVKNTRAAVVVYIVLNKEEMIFNCLFRRRLLGASTATLEAPSNLQMLKIYSLWLVCAAFAVFVIDLDEFNSTNFSLLCHFIMVLYCIDVINFYLQEKNFFTYQIIMSVRLWNWKIKARVLLLKILLGIPKSCKFWILVDRFNENKY